MGERPLISFDQMDDRRIAQRQQPFVKPNPPHPAMLQQGGIELAPHHCRKGKQLPGFLWNPIKPLGEQRFDPRCPNGSRKPGFPDFC